ncbi:ABC-2 type transport system permease protein [Fontibacillus solani]|uniref:ABC-2 type transport system permease protein n=1 Tax=Fontibacillus solani TaxID=1572857 RepID=A0A7W3SR91_9BACL|nr:ABC transporter permease subunit [Fontibacillus solani]MBA9084781.1 ABC-2 type transport system permease protein [Fontibacillus solani]
MRQAWLMYRKELLGMARSYQLLWIPVVFMLLVVMQPVTSYYMPDILAASGSVPEELVADFPIPGPAEVMASVLGQYSTFGVFVLVIAGMKIVSGERYGGTAALVLVRPISSASFILAKWAGQMTLLILSFTISYAAAWYYTVQLLGHVPWREGLAAGGLYMMWLAFAISLTILLSTLLRGIAVAMISLLMMFALSLVQNLAPSWFSWSPAGLLKLAAATILGAPVEAIYYPIIMTLLLCVVCIGIAIWSLRRQAIPDTSGE